MRKLLVILFLLLFTSVCLSQDYIYKKDRTITKGKVLEVTMDLIKYKKIELPKGPVYEISKKDVYKIHYANGYADILDATFDPLSGDSISGMKKIDTLHYAMLYVLFYDGFDKSQKFPLYFNEKYICTLRNHQRLTFKLYSEGLLHIKRLGGKKTGPSVELIILHGNDYGIRIEEPYPQGLNPNKRFSINAISDSEEVATFLEQEFYKWKPFKQDELFMQEDLGDIIIQ